MKQSSLAAYLKQNALLLLSTLAALALFAARSKILLLLEGAIFCAVALYTWLDRTREKGAFSWAAAIPAGLFCVVGLWCCFEEGILGGLTPAAAPILAVAAFYAFYRLCRRMEAIVCGEGPAARGFGNLKHNWLIPVSCAAFFLLAGGTNPEGAYLRSLLAAVGLTAMVSCRMPELMEQMQRSGPGPWYALAALGVILAQMGRWPQGTARLVLALASIPFLLVATAAFGRKLEELIRDTVRDLTKQEKILYACLLAAFAALVAWTYFTTDAFYGTAQTYDIVYTSDSPALVRGNAYLLLLNEENDLRQPLFAVFAAPFVGPWYTVSRMLRLDESWHALLLQLPQVGMILLGHILLANALGLTGGKRLGFVLLLSVSYPSLLFLLMMEQYAAAYFYVAWTLLTLGRDRPDPVAYWGAGGTLLTSASLLILSSREHPVRSFPRWLRAMVDGGLGFLFALLAFGRLEVLLGAVSRLMWLNQFSGEELTFFQKLSQYTCFVLSCLVAPGAQVIPNMWGAVSWQLLLPQGIRWGAAVVLALCAAGLLRNRRDRMAWAAAFWIGLSVLALLLFGWGTQENGLILYGLYFGWAFLGLIYLLAQSLCRKERVLTLLTAAATMILAAVNIPAILALIRFGAEYYPV